MKEYITGCKQLDSFQQLVWAIQRKYPRSTLMALPDWNPPVACGFPSQRARLANNMEIGSMSWHRHVNMGSYCSMGSVGPYKNFRWFHFNTTVWDIISYIKCHYWFQLYKFTQSIIWKNKNKTYLTNQNRKCDHSMSNTCLTPLLTDKVQEMFEAVMSVNHIHYLPTLPALWA